MDRAILTDARIPLIVTFVALSGMVLGVHSIGRIYPLGLVALFIGLATLLVLGLASTSFWSVLAGGITLGVGYRLVVNYFTTPIGSSPQSQPARMDTIAETGSAAASGTHFYGDAPIHFLVGAMSASVFDVSAFESVFLYSVAIGVLLPLIVISLCRYAGIHDRRALAAAALLAVCTAEGIRRSYWIVAQTTGSILWWLAVMVLAKHVAGRDGRLFGILALFTSAAVITHKLPITVFMGVLGALLVLLAVDKLTWDDVGQLSPTRQILLLVTFIGSLTIFQWIYVGPLLPSIIARIGRIFSEPGATGSSETYVPEGAVEALPGITAYFIEYPSVLSLFVERGHGVWLVLIAGFGWLYFFMSERSRRPSVQVLLAAAAVCVALLPIGVAAVKGLNPTRIMVLIEPVLVVLIIGVLWWARDISVVLASALSRFRRGMSPAPHATDGRQRRLVRIGHVVVTALLILLVATQVFSAAAAPDYANGPRYYADTAEAQAETTLCEYAAEDIHVDSYYNRFTDSERKGCSATTSIGKSASSPLFDKNITPETHQTVAYRTDVDVYIGDGGDRWRLTWDPEESLAKDYNTIYDNGSVVTFRAPESATTE